MEDQGAKPFMSDSTYDKLKFLAQVLLPGLGTLYFTLAQTLGLPAAEQVVGTITAVDAFLGLFLAKSSSSYLDSDHWYDGTVQEEHLPEELTGRKRVVMKVVK